MHWLDWRKMVRAVAAAAAAVLCVLMPTYRTHFIDILPAENVQMIRDLHGIELMMAYKDRLLEKK